MFVGISLGWRFGPSLGGPAVSLPVDVRLSSKYSVVLVRELVVSPTKAWRVGLRKTAVGYQPATAVQLLVDVHVHVSCKHAPPGLGGVVLQLGVPLHTLPMSVSTVLSDSSCTKGLFYPLSFLPPC